MDISKQFSPAVVTTSFSLPETAGDEFNEISMVPSDTFKELHTAAAQAEEKLSHHENATGSEINDVTSRASMDSDEMPKKEKFMPIAFDDELDAFLRSAGETPQIKIFEAALTSWKMAKEKVIELEQEQANRIKSVSEELEGIKALQDQAKQNISNLKNKITTGGSFTEFSGLATAIGNANQKLIPLGKECHRLIEKLESLQLRSLTASAGLPENPNEKLLKDLDDAKKKLHEADLACRELAEKIEKFDDLEFSSSKLDKLKELGALGKNLLNEEDAEASKKFDAFLKANFDEVNFDKDEKWVQTHDFNKES